uniref:Uncharacterized protein n=1 Tax=Arundo donax TaxID=35708 RepID=A0A0A9BSM8_ARUDO
MFKSNDILRKQTALKVLLILLNFCDNCTSALCCKSSE